MERCVQRHYSFMYTQTISERLSCTKRETNLEGSVRSRSDHTKDYTYQFALQCAIAFVCIIYRNDLILTDFYLAAGWLIHQTAKFNSPPTFPAICGIIIHCPLWGVGSNLEVIRLTSEGAWQLHSCACVDYSYYW